MKQFLLISLLLFINHLLPFIECLIFDKKSLPRDYIADGLKLQSVDKTKSPINLFGSGSHYRPVRGYGKDYDYETGESVEDEFEEEFVPLKATKDKENDNWSNKVNNNNNGPESHRTDKFPSNEDNIGSKSLSKSPDDLPRISGTNKQMKSSSSESKDWRYSVCEEFLLRESGISKIPKALRYHVDIDDHKRLNVNPPLDKKEMIKCLRKLAIIHGTDSRNKGLEHLNNIKQNQLSPSPFSAPSSSLIPPSSKPSKWPSSLSSDGDRSSSISPANLEANRARLLSRLSEEQIRKLLLLLTEILDRRIKPDSELGKAPVHGKLTPLMFPSEMGFKSGISRQPPLPSVGPSSIPPSNGPKFPILTPLSGSGSTIMDPGSRNLIDPLSSSMHYNNPLGFNSPSSRVIKPYPRYSSNPVYGRPFQPPSPSYPGYNPFLTSSYPLPSPLLPNNLHPATQITRFPFTSPSGVKKLLVNEVLGVKKIEKYNGEREVEVGGGPKTVVVHEGELHVDPTGESAAIEIDENKLKRYRESLMAAYGAYPHHRLPGIHGHGMNFPGRGSSTNERFGPQFYDSFRDPGFFNDSPFPPSPPAPLLDSSSSSQAELSALPVSPSSVGRYHRDRHHHHRHQSYLHNNANEYVYSSDQGSTSAPPPGVQITKCDENGKCTGSPGSIVGEEESIKSKYKANNSATRAAYGRYGAKYLGLTLTSIANYALGNLMGVLYAPFMKSRDQNKAGKGKPGKRPVTIPIGGRPVKGMFDPTTSSLSGGHNEIDKVSKEPNNQPGKGQPLDQEIDSLIDDYDDVDGENNTNSKKKAKRRRKKRRR
ncbi:uncharacterized protein LOC128393802 [Panonychus citri]|uniref:uncharacterized protein LOC128393802 n=1 Tax=Panonychus citri TaxID=50023 RepID=UPI0023080F38|nr:uncharacterized protein LOC128393802 [Panonychus citri]